MINENKTTDIIDNVINNNNSIDVKTEITENEESIESYFKNDEESIKIRQDILKEISKFNLHCDNVTLSTLYAISQNKHVINISPKGEGKSRSTKELLDYLMVPYGEFNGTALGLFKELQKDGVILIDEAEQILSDKKCRQIFLSALEEKETVWITNKTETRHFFKGILICNLNNDILNKSESNNTIHAVFDRFVVNRFAFNGQQTKERDAQMPLNPKGPIFPDANIDVWKTIIERLNMTGLCDRYLCKNFKGSYDILNALEKQNGQMSDLSDGLSVENISQSVKNELFRALLDLDTQKRTKREITIKKYLLEKIHGVNGDSQINSSRPFIKCKSVADFSYKLLGDFSIVDMLLDSIKQTDKVEEIIQMTTISRSEKIKRIAVIQGKSIRTIQRFFLKIEKEDRINKQNQT